MSYDFFDFLGNIGVLLILIMYLALQTEKITLTVHSSLDAIGLTAAVATKLASYGISANVVAAYYHDHIFVQTEKADEALLALKEFSGSEN